MVKPKKLNDKFYPERSFIMSALKIRAYLVSETFTNLNNYLEDPSIIRKCITPSISIGKRRVTLNLTQNDRVTQMVTFEIDGNIDYTDKELTILTIIHTYSALLEKVCTLAGKSEDLRRVEITREKCKFLPNVLVN